MLVSLHDVDDFIRAGRAMTVWSGNVRHQRNMCRDNFPSIRRADPCLALPSDTGASGALEFQVNRSHIRPDRRNDTPQYGAWWRSASPGAAEGSDFIRPVQVFAHPVPDGFGAVIKQTVKGFETVFPECRFIPVRHRGDFADNRGVIQNWHGFVFRSRETGDHAK